MDLLRPEDPQIAMVGRSEMESNRYRDGEGSSFGLPSPNTALFRDFEIVTARPGSLIIYRHRDT